MKIGLGQNHLLPGLLAPVNPSGPPYFSAHDGHLSSLDASRCPACGWGAAAEHPEVLLCRQCSPQGREIQCTEIPPAASSNGGCRPL